MKHPAEFISSSNLIWLTWLCSNIQMVLKSITRVRAGLQERFYTLDKWWKKKAGKWKTERHSSEKPQEMMRWGAGFWLAVRFQSNNWNWWEQKVAQGVKSSDRHWQWYQNEIVSNDVRGNFFTYKQAEVQMWRAYFGMHTLLLEVKWFPTLKSQLRPKENTARLTRGNLCVFWVGLRSSWSWFIKSQFKLFKFFHFSWVEAILTGMFYYYTVFNEKFLLVLG